ncbi:MAG: hypothetical protein WCK78_15750 [Paludibacter sp.]
MRNFNNYKKAGITIEVALALALGIVVLLSVFTVFSNNLKAMFGATKFNNLAKTHTVAAKNTGYSLSQQTIGIVGEQGLQQHMTDAQAGIDQAYLKSIQKPPVPLTAQEQIDLAKYFTEKKILNQWKVPVIDPRSTAKTATGATNADYFPQSEIKLAKDNGIDLGSFNLGLIYVDSMPNPDDGINWDTQKTLSTMEREKEPQKLAWIDKALSSFDNVKKSLNP